jgi:citrate lyase synthetase
MKQFGLSLELINDNVFSWKLKFDSFENEQLSEDLNRLNSAIKYPNVKPLVINTGLPISATKAREALINKDKSEFFKLIPNIKEKEYIYNLLESLEITK